jgi:CSLREA domain-containing protein
MRRVFLLALAALVLPAAAASRPSAAVVVNTNADHAVGVCDPIDCTLREAITVVNSGGADAIQFSIGAGPQTIALSNALGALPAIIHPVVIDGTTQPGWSGGVVIALDGSSLGASAPGLVLGAGSGGSLIKNLDIQRFPGDGIQVNSAADILQGNYIGTNLVGTAAAANGGNGISLSSNALNTLIGTNGDCGSDVAERNVISGNAGDGVHIDNSAGTVVAGNFIGIDAAANPLGNGAAGIDLVNGTSQVVVGTDGSAVGCNQNERNVISANSNVGVVVFSSQAQSANNNVIAGNVIGANTAITSTTGYENHNGGISLYGTYNPTGPVRRAVTNTRIGTNADGISDVDEANFLDGTINGSGVFATIADTTLIRGNYIGTNATNANLGNSCYGVLIAGGSGNQVGGSAAGTSNTVSWNGCGGVSLQRGGTQVCCPSTVFTDATTGNTIQANTITKNLADGVNNILTEETSTAAASAPGDGPTDNVIKNNSVSQNNGRGISLSGSSPSIDGNTVTNNNGSGIALYADFFSDNPVNTYSPATAGDDFLSRPSIGLTTANTITGNCANTGGSPCAGIYSLDTKASNEATLTANNTNNGQAQNSSPYVQQDWYGTIETIAAGVPTAAGVTITSANAGPSYVMSFTSTCTGGVLNNTIVHGTSNAISCTDITTWPKITQYVVNTAGTKTNYTPETAQATNYSFDGDATTQPTDTGVGFIGEGIATGPFSRYQVMQVPSPPTAVALATFRVRRTATGMTLTWRTASETGLLGFNVWRGSQRVNAALIRARHAGEALGATYRFVDHLARRGGAYRLELVRFRSG